MNHIWFIKAEVYFVYWDRLLFLPSRELPPGRNPSIIVIFYNALSCKCMYKI